MTTALLDGLTQHHGALVETGRDSWLCLPIMSSGRDDIICGIGDWRRSVPGKAPGAVLSNCVHSHVRVKSAGTDLQQFKPGERDNG
jgi:hypothetical protein